MKCWCNMFNLFKKKKNNNIPIRYWDFSYANQMLKDYKDYIELFELAMLYDYNYVCETFIENGEIVKTMGGAYQMYSGNISGVKHTNIDIPCIHVIYKGGNEEWIACYIETLNGKQVSSFGESHRKLTKDDSYDYY